MLARSSCALERVHRVRRIQRLSLFCVGSACSALTFSQYHRQSQKSEAHAIVQQALNFCSAFEAHCEQDGEPQFGLDNVPLPLAKRMQRSLWYVPLRGSGRRYALMLRADTGRLCYVFNVSSSKETAPSAAHNPPTSLPHRAIDQSLLYLQRLKVVPPDAQIALDDAPESVRDDTGWRVGWNVRTNQSDTDETLRVTVSRTDGRLLQFVDTSALNEKAK